MFPHEELHTPQLPTDVIWGTSQLWKAVEHLRCGTVEWLLGYCDMNLVPCLEVFASLEKAAVS